MKKTKDGSAYKESAHLVISIFRGTGVLNVLRGNSVDTKKYIVIEEGLFLLPVTELTKQEILTKYGVVLPQEFTYEHILPLITPI